MEISVKLGLGDPRKRKICRRRCTSRKGSSPSWRALLVGALEHLGGSRGP